MHNIRYKKVSSKIAKRNKIRQIFGLFLKIGLPVVVLVGLIFLMRASFLQINNFEVLGTETVPSENIKNIASNFISGNKFFLLPKSNILFLNKTELLTTLLATFPRIEKIEINKQFFNNKIELKVTERKADFLWCSAQNECFFMTNCGLVFQKILESELSEYGTKLIFKGILEGNPLMKNFVTTQEMQKYLSLVDVLKNSKIIVTEINIESTDKAVAKTNIGDIIFNPKEENLSLVGQNIVLLINEIKSKNTSVIFNYIDARFGNKIFYKLL